MKTSIVFMLLVGISSCNGDTPPPKQAEPTTSASVAASVAPSASVEPPAAAKGTITAFAHAATSGTVDKVGEKDGAFKPDGVKDTVYDLEYEGAATAIFVMTCDKQGELTSEFDSDTLVGDQTIPKEIAGILNAGKTTAGLVVYEGDKLMNGKDGSLAPLAEGKHKLVLHISKKDIPKAPVRAFVLLPDGSLVKSPVLLPK